MYKILIVEDDKNLCSNIADGLLKWGFEPVCVEDFENVSVEFTKLNPHLVIMDINLPYFDGFYWCKR